MTISLPKEINDYIFSGNKLFVQLAANYLYKEKEMHVNEIQEYINKIGDNGFTSFINWGDEIVGYNGIGYNSKQRLEMRYNRTLDGDFYKFKLVDNNIEIL